MKIKIIKTIKKHKKLFIIISAIIVIILLDNIFYLIIDYDVIIARNRGGGWIGSNVTIDNVTLVSSKTGLRKIGFYYSHWDGASKKIIYSTWNDDKFTRGNDIYISQDTDNYSYFQKYDYLNEYDPLMLVGDYNLNNGIYTQYSQVRRVIIGSYVYYLRYEDNKNYYKINIDTHEITPIPFNKYSLLEKVKMADYPIDFERAVLLDYYEGLNDIMMQDKYSNYLSYDIDRNIYSTYFDSIAVVANRIFFSVYNEYMTIYEYAPETNTEKQIFRVKMGNGRFDRVSAVKK